MEWILFLFQKNTNRKERLKKIVQGLQGAGWKLEDKKENKNG